MALKTKVVINSITIKDDNGAPDPKLLFTWEYERTLEHGISELIITVPQKINDTVSIWKGFTTSTDTKIFEGFISNFNPDKGMIEIVCKDKMWDLVRKNVNDVYEDSGPQAGQISAIAKDLIETYGGLTSAEQPTGTSTGETISEFRCVNADIYERLNILARAVNFAVFYDAVNDTVHFEPKGFNNSELTLTVGTEIIGVPTWENDTDQMINDLRIDGAVSETQLRFPVSGTGQIGVTAGFETTGITLPKTPENVKLTIDSANPPTTLREGGSKDGTSGHYFYVDRENKIITPAVGTTFDANDFAFVDYSWMAPAPIHMANQGSKDSFGSFENQTTLPDVVTISDSEARATEILARFSQPFLIGEIIIKSSSTISLNIGDTINVIDNVSNPSINKEFVITKQLIKYPGTSEELTIGDQALRMADWQLNVEERLKRLEDSFLRNQDLLMELINVNYEMSNVPIYKRIFSETYDEANLRLIWSHPTKSLWGTHKWGTEATAFEAEVDEFIQQYLNLYTEDFFDDDFEDTNGTVTGWTSGSIDFTSGQIALSKSVDFNNTTITAATLNSTEVSGSFTYQLSADGGSNFENVTPGTAHTFTNTGTDLRFKITENAASTGEISQVLITDYH